MNELLKKLLEFHTEIRERANKAMASLQPLDQHQLAGAISSTLREFEWSIDRMDGIAKTIESLAAALPEHEKEVITAALEKATTAGEILTKEAHDGIVAAAKKAGADEVHAEAKVLAEKQEAIAARRKQVVEAHDEAIANAMSDEALEEDTFLVTAQVLANRSTEMQEKGITSDLDVFSTMLAASDEQYKSYIDIATSVSTGKKTTPGKPTITAAKKGGVEAPPAPTPAKSPSAPAGTPAKEDVLAYS